MAQDGTSGGRRGGKQGGRGFAGMDHEEQRRIARKGGQASSGAQQRDEQGRFSGSSSSKSTVRVSTRGSAGSTP
jgi:general stress protein YciG